MLHCAQDALASLQQAGGPHVPIDQGHPAHVDGNMLASELSTSHMTFSATVGELQATRQHATALEAQVEELQHQLWQQRQQHQHPGAAAAAAAAAAATTTASAAARALADAGRLLGPGVAPEGTAGVQPMMLDWQQQRQRQPQQQRQQAGSGGLLEAGVALDNEAGVQAMLDWRQPQVGGVDGPFLLAPQLVGEPWWAALNGTGAAAANGYSNTAGGRGEAAASAAVASVPPAVELLSTLGGPAAAAAAAAAAELQRAQGEAEQERWKKRAAQQDARTLIDATQALQARAVVCGVLQVSVCGVRPFGGCTCHPIPSACAALCLSGVLDRVPDHMLLCMPT
jgi:hypothetical protein